MDWIIPTYLMLRLPSIIIDVVVRQHVQLTKWELQNVFLFFVLQSRSMLVGLLRSILNGNILCSTGLRPVPSSWYSLCPQAPAKEAHVSDFVKNAKQGILW